MTEGESKVKQVLSTLWSYLYSSLPPNEDFIIQLQIDGILARNDATKLRAFARLGGRACIHDLITHMYDFFDEPALETFCAFLDKYGQPTRPLMLEVAAKVREEMGIKLQQIHVLAPEDPQKGTSRADVDVAVVKSVSDLMPYYMDMTAHLFELAAALGVVELSRALIDGNGTPQDRCLKILSHWLESTPSPTWACLCQKLGVTSSFKAVVHKIARDHNLSTAVSHPLGVPALGTSVPVFTPPATHTVPDTSVPATFPPGSSSPKPKPPAPYTPASTKVRLSSRVATQRGGRGKDGPSSSQSTTSGNTVFSDKDAALRFGIVAALDLSEGTSQQTHTAWLAKNPPHRKMQAEFSRLLSRLAKIFNKHIDDLKPYLRTCQKSDEWPFNELEVEDIDSANKVQTMFNKIYIENCWLNTEIFTHLIYILPKKSQDKAKQHLEDYHKLLGVFSKYLLLSHITKHDARLEHFYSSDMFPKLRVTYDVNMEDFDVSELFEEREFLSEKFQIPKEAFHYLEAERTNSTLVTWALDISIEKAFELIQRVAHHFWSLKEHLIIKVEIYGVFQLHLKGMSLPYHIKNALQSHQELLAFTEHVSRQFLALVDYVYSHPKRKGPDHEPCLKPALKSVLQPSGPSNVAGSETQRQARTGDVMAQCGNPSRYAATKPAKRDLKVVADRAGSNWSHLLTSLGIPWTTIEKIRTESPTDLWEACMKGLVLWLKGGISDSNEPVTFGTLFAALKKSEMADCVSLLVDRLDKRSTPHPRLAHEDKDEDLSSTLTSQKREKHSLLSSLSEYMTMTKNLQTKVRQKNKDPIQYFKEEKLRVMEREVKLLRKGKGKAVTTVQKPPRNWRKMKCQKTLECGGVCWSIAVQGDVVCVGVEGRVLLFSKTSGALVCELGSDQIKDVVYGVAFVEEDTIVVSAKDKRLRTYTTKGQLVSTFDSGKDRFAPCGLTVGPDGHIFVCDYVNDCVCVFNVDGKLLSSFGSRGSGVGHFNTPWDVCMDGEGLLFISDRGNSRICVHSVEGAFIREFPTPRPPTCVAATHCNHLVVSSVWSHTVMIMTTSGQLVHEFGGWGSGPGQFTYPQGVAVDNEDCVYVCDRGRVKVY